MDQFQAVVSDLLLRRHPFCRTSCLWYSTGGIPGYPCTKLHRLHHRRGGPGRSSERPRARSPGDLAFCYRPHVTRRWSHARCVLPSSPCDPRWSHARCIALLARSMWSPPQAVCHQTWSPLQAGCHLQGPTRFAPIHRVAHGSHRFIVCSRHSGNSLPNPWLGGNHGFGKLDPVLLVLVVRFHNSHRLVVKSHNFITI